MSCLCVASRFSYNTRIMSKYGFADFTKIRRSATPFLQRTLWTLLRPVQPGQRIKLPFINLPAFATSIRPLSAINQHTPQDSVTTDTKKQESEEKTKISIINNQSGSGKVYLPFIYKYSKHGFTIGKNKVIGSVALFPGGILSWKVISHHHITPESLAIFPLLDPKLEILILGVGEKVVQMPQSVWEFARSNRIALEVLDTPNACATYNFLTEEGRRTGAALIPPENI